MNKSIFYILISLITTAILSIIGYILYQKGIRLSLMQCICLFSLLILCLGMLISQNFYNKVKQLTSDYDWAEVTINAYNNINIIYRQSFWWIFALTNLAFLFHTINFMWGGQDWASVRSTVDIKESLQEGNFSAYLLQELLFEGKILPVINNMTAFFLLSLAGILLGNYWNIPQKKITYIVFSLLFIVNPYTLNWLYHVRNTLGHLALPAIVMVALKLSSNECPTHIKKIIYNSTAVMLFLIALGTYFPIICFALIAVLGKILLKITFTNASLRETARSFLQPIVNFTSALLIYLFITLVLNETGIITYNAEFLPLIININQIPVFIKSIITQFTVLVPFTDIPYRGFNLILIMMALFTIIYKTSCTKSALKGLGLFFLIIILSKLHILWQTNPTEYLMKADFFSVPFISALAFAILVKNSGEYLKRLTYTIALLIIFMGFIRTSYALKVWKFGFETEQKLSERIITRLERMPEFSIDKTYKLLQIGSQSLRHKFYLQKPYEKNNNELLDYAYYQEGKAKDAYNFFYQTDFLISDANLKTAISNDDVRNYILYKARTYPAKESIAIINDYILFILDEKALVKIQKLIKDNYVQ